MPARAAISPRMARVAMLKFLAARTNDARMRPVQEAANAANTTINQSRFFERPSIACARRVTTPYSLAAASNSVRLFVIFIIAASKPSSLKTIKERCNSLPNLPKAAATVFEVRSNAAAPPDIALICLVNSKAYR